VILRSTQKILRYLPISVAGPCFSSTALGDWYVNRFYVNRYPAILLVSSKSLLAIVESAREIRSLPDRLASLVARRLERLGVGTGVVDSEVGEMSPVIVGPTADRSMLGTMVDFVKTIPFYVSGANWDESQQRDIEDKLGETPCRISAKTSNTIWPSRESARLLRSRWETV
jgi:hypothetical protein